MKPFPFKVTCQVCGGPGVGSPQTAGCEWLANYTVVHSDPRVCQSYLEDHKKALERKEKELAEKEKALKV